MTILVTGATGFVGSHVVDALCARSDEVIVVDDLSTGDRANVRDGAALRVVDISDGPALEAGRRVDAYLSLRNSGQQTRAALHR